MHIEYTGLDGRIAVWDLENEQDLLEW